MTTFDIVCLVFGAFGAICFLFMLVFFVQMVDVVLDIFSRKK